MASIQKRGKKFQYTISHTVNGKTQLIRKGGFSSAKEASVAAAEIEVKLAKGIVPYLTPVPFDNYFKQWVDLYKKKVAHSTRLHYNYTARAIKEYFGSTPLQKITHNHYQEFLNEFGEGKSKQTVEKVNSHIRSCLKYAVRDQIIPYNFTEGTILYFTTQAKKANDKYLDVKESEILFNELLKKLSSGLGYYILLLALTSGLRYEELVGLTVNDFDFNSNTININKTWGYNNRMPKGFGPTKNESSNRTISIDEITMNEFKKLLKTLKPNSDKLVFFSPSSKYKVISNTLANKLLKKTLTNLGLNPITVHGLRHTHASVLLSHGVSIYYVSKRLGHKDVETTHKHYTHLTKELHEKDSKNTVAIFNNMKDNQ
ncbi:tyrosine-type recombinase/integrase [Fredinandcohnia sp. QZ13]|uniref:tyrosine-type recombinase/integrase n=1 Tax=Fredinandcohnia sp. QZ13 TaxID=3073144 RepID=UPI0028535439|nr:tyrosine-type recombinase/integrase [Fredinandcohnia sp. QZ13]MDR4887550.1 tyrosine-type recombinase/integrase [Fredinandcohnia sp. QZ13]